MAGPSPLSPGSAPKPAQDVVPSGAPTKVAVRKTTTSPAPSVKLPDMPGTTAPEKVPVSVDAKAAHLADRKVRSALARLSSDLGKAKCTDDAAAAIKRAQHALTGVDQPQVLAVLHAFSDKVGALGFKDCPDFLKLNRAAWAPVKDGHLQHAYADLAAAAQQLNDLHEAQKEAIAEDVAREMLGKATDFAIGFVDGANPIPNAPAHGAVFQHDSAYRSGHFAGVLAGFAVDLGAMISGGGMMAAGGAMALASGCVLAPGSALSAAAGASLIGAGAAGMLEHQQKLKQHTEPIVIHEARTLDQYRASGKKPPKDVTLPSGKPDPSTVPTGPRHEVNPKWTPEKQESVRGEQHVMDAAAKEGYQAEWIAEKPSHKKAPGELSGNPDNRLEGKTFDIYTPREASVDSVMTGITRKLDKNQTERVIINLELHSVRERDLIERLESQPPSGLKEVIIFNDGKFVFLNLRK